MCTEVRPEISRPMSHRFPASEISAVLARTCCRIIAQNLLLLQYSSVKGNSDFWTLHLGENRNAKFPVTHRSYEDSSVTTQISARHTQSEMWTRLEKSLRLTDALEFGLEGLLVATVGDIEEEVRILAL